MNENTGITMRILALDELMKVLSEVGRTAEDPQHKPLLRLLFQAAKERHDFLKLSSREDE